MNQDEKENGTRMVSKDQPGDGHFVLGPTRWRAYFQEKDVPLSCSSWPTEIRSS